MQNYVYRRNIIKTLEITYFISIVSNRGNPFNAACCGAAIQDKVKSKMASSVLDLDAS